MTKEERIEYRKKLQEEESREPLPVAPEVQIALQNQPFRHILRQNARYLTDQQVDAAVLMLDLHAQAKGIPFEQIVGKYFAPRYLPPKHSVVLS
jgi:hypothetical protein